MASPALPQLIETDHIPGPLLSAIDTRDVALWLRSVPVEPDARNAVPSFLGLPWRLVLSEVSEPWLLDALESQGDARDPRVRRRGFIEIIYDDPTQKELPQRCLPVYVLPGRPGSAESGFDAQMRRMSMLNTLRRSGVRHLLVLSTASDPLPPQFDDLLKTDFHPFVVFATDNPEAPVRLRNWIRDRHDVLTSTLLRRSLAETTTSILQHYEEHYPDERIVIRLRIGEGRRSIDVSDLDDPERPLLSSYDLLQERDLAHLTPDDLTEQDLASFFESPDASWRPYAAGLPWSRDDRAQRRFRRILDRIEAVGSDENCITYVRAEPGGGGTTFARALAWELARDGYPVLLAKQIPFVPDALPVANFMNRVKQEIEPPNHAEHGDISPNVQIDHDERRVDHPAPHESAGRAVPWIIVFDRIHWEHREAELRRFRAELQGRGRPVCVLVVSGPVRDAFDTAVFKEIGVLDPTLDREDAGHLGRHLNRFLRVHGRDRKQWQWKQFHEQHTVRHLEGSVSFWIALSFWIRGQYDLSEPIQEWLYRSFREHATDLAVRDAVLEIAALAVHRLPFPEGLLPSGSEWPTSALLNDRRSGLASMGLVRCAAGGDKYWSFAHDILGRLLLNALFHDRSTKVELGFGEAQSADHIRFLLLRRLSKRNGVEHRAYREFGDEFATSIFKIDPDHGQTAFAPFWRAVLEALDGMPSVLRNGSRVFRHHTSVSRRRIATFDSNLYGVTSDDRVELLERAIVDIDYALEAIQYTPGSEPNLNLYNSLAHACHDLADIRENMGCAPAEIARLRRRGAEATGRAYEESPTNSYVVETYVRNLLAVARATPESAVENLVQALEILFAAMYSREESYRRQQLDQLATTAVDALLECASATASEGEPNGPVEVLTRAWLILVDGLGRGDALDFAELPEGNRRRAIEALGHPNGRGNRQVLRLSYDLIGSTYPDDHERQVEILDQLDCTGRHASPQLRLEYGILLYQNDRAREGEQVFRELRRLWRESEHYVNVPKRLHWLWDLKGGERRTVAATVVSSGDVRPMAGVREFQGARVPFRPEEFGRRGAHAGTGFRCHVSFGHNGPFLRPVTTAGR